MLPVLCYSRRNDTFQRGLQDRVGEGMGRENPPSITKVGKRCLDAEDSPSECMSAGDDDFLTGYTSCLMMLIRITALLSLLVLLWKQTVQKKDES